MLDPASLGEHSLGPNDEGYLAPATFVTVVPEGRVVSDSGVVIAPNHKLLADVSRNFRGRESRHDVLFAIRFPPVVRVKGSLAVLSSSQHQNYYHWMFDVLPRVDFLERARVTVDRYFVNDRSPYQAATLKALGIDASKHIPLRSRSHFEAERLIVPSLPGARWPSMRSARFLRERFLQRGHADHGRRLYISRGDAAQRRVTNEPQVVEFLAAQGFDVVQLANRDFRSQVELFASASVVVGAHGAGLTNLVFSDPGSSLIEFMPDQIQYPYFEMLCGIQGIRYARLSCRTESALMDHAVDILDLKRALATLKLRAL